MFRIIYYTLDQKGETTSSRTDRRYYRTIKEAQLFLRANGYKYESKPKYGTPFKYRTKKSRAIITSEHFSCSQILHKKVLD